MAELKLQKQLSGKTQDNELYLVDTTDLRIPNDHERLEALGHKEELERHLSLWTLTALCLCLMATWEALSSVVTAALLSGGPPCLFYNYVLSFLCSICVATSLAEIASIFPTAGGQYHWVAALSQGSSQSIAAFMTGWISVGGQVVLTASAAFAAGLQFQALITLNEDAYMPQRWQGMLFYWAVLVYAALMNIWGTKALPHANTVAGVIHIAGFTAVVIVLGVKAPKNTTASVFTAFVNSSGWQNDGIAWLVGLLSAVYPFLGYDAACHLAEEMPNASRNVPLAMVGSVVVNGCLGLIYCILLLYSVNSLDAILETRTGYPFMQIFLDATNSKAATSVMAILMPIIATAATIAGIASTSRTLWAFARDKATPYDGYFSHVNKRLKIPSRAIILITVLQMLLGFLYLGNTTAFNAILSMAIVGMYVSYGLPIAYMLWSGRRGIAREQRGSFRLNGKVGAVLNIVSLIWIAVVVVFSTFPTLKPVTPQNMNYSVVVMAAWVIVGALYYYSSGRSKFQAPASSLQVLSGLRVA